MSIIKIRPQERHSSSKGTEAERMLSELLRKYLPQKYSIGSGFLSENEKLSPQTDIVIYDNMLNVPVYKGVASSVFKAGSVYGCIEVTIGKLTRQKLEADIKKLGKLRNMLKKNIGFKKIRTQPHPTGRGSVVAEETFKAGPPPRTYIRALSGTTYTAPEKLAADVKKITTKYEAHMHGVLVIDSNRSNSPEKEWLIWTKAFSDYETDYIKTDAFYTLLKTMNANFMGMHVGIYPAAN
ncbi:MAG: DUF6602 domain-containing protein [bacterium]|mgnify:CR=1 FL=1